MSLLHHYYTHYYILLQIHYVIVTSLLRHYYILLQIHYYLLLRPYYVIITSLLHMAKLCLMSPLLRIITLCVSIRMSLLRIITIITCRCCLAGLISARGRHRRCGSIAGGQTGTTSTGLQPLSPFPVHHRSLHHQLFHCFLPIDCCR